MELDEKCIVVSSAYKSDILWSTYRGKSFKYKRKSKGPSMLPCGIPYLIFCADDS
jgi:hypothetical protein